VALSPQEEQELAAIEAEIQTRQGGQAQGLTPQEEFELAQIEQELAARREAPVSVNQSKEADLGFVNRARYAIEPLESNRKALLVQEFGAENLMQDESGNVYVRQNGEFRPVNAEGFSVADVANFAGATPEMVGGLVGTGAGAVAGAGVGSIPAAAGLGAAGGALGSAARQGLSAILGTPQVATARERVAETGLSAGLGGLFGGIGQGAKVAAPHIKKAGGEAIEGVSKLFKKTPKDVDEKQVTDVVSEVKITPELAEDVTKLPGDEVLSREMVADQLQKLEGIAARQNLPRPTYAQAAGGRAIQAEGKIIDTPLVGGSVRKQVDSQLAAVKKNLEKIAGRFIDEDSTADQVGIAVKETSKRIVDATKRTAQELYQKVDEIGANAMIGKKTLFNKYRDKAAELGLVRFDGKRELYSPETGLTPDEFKVLQDMFFDHLGAIERTASPKIRFQGANAMRRTVNNMAEELAGKNPNAARILKGFGKELDSTVEGILNREHKKLGEVFKEANRKWAKYRDDDEFLGKFLPDNIGVEKVVKKMMNDSENIKRMKDLVGEGPVKEAGKSFVKDILSGLSKSGVARADSALSAIRKNATQIKEAIGEDAYENLVDNLYYLNRVNQPLNISRPSLYNLLFDPASSTNLKGLLVNVATSAKTYAESKGMGLGDVAKGAAKKSTRPINTTFKKVIESGPAKQGAAGNVLFDSTQRQGAYFTRGPAGDKKEKRR
jgi:hypothetical protein